MSRTAACVDAPVPRPGPITSAWNRAAASTHDLGPSRGGEREARPPPPGDRRRRRPPASRGGPCPRRPAGPRPRRRWAAPVIPADPATTSTAACHLWLAVDAGAAATSRTSAAVDQARRRARRRRGRCRRPPPVPASDRPGSSTRPGLSAAKVTVRLAGSARPCAAPVRPSTPLGMSTASTGAPTGRGGVLAAEAGAVGGVHHEVGGREPRRRVARRRRPRTRAPRMPQAAGRGTDRRPRCSPCRRAPRLAARRRRRAGRGPRARRPRPPDR